MLLHSFGDSKVQDNGGSYFLQDANAPESAPIYNKEQSCIALHNLQSRKESPLGQGYSSCKHFDNICSLVQSAAFQRSKNVIRIHMSCFQDRCFSSIQRRREIKTHTESGKAPTLLHQGSHCSLVVFHGSPRVFSKWQSYSNRYGASDQERGVNKAPQKTDILTIQ